MEVVLNEVTHKYLGFYIFLSFQANLVPAPSLAGQSNLKSLGSAKLPPRPAEWVSPFFPP
jgi:hypothetical protein